MINKVAHITWCKERAVLEFNYYLKEEGIESAIRNGLTSMMSDVRKHPETHGLMTLIMMTMVSKTIKTSQDFTKFINGFKE